MIEAIWAGVRRPVTLLAALLALATLPALAQEGIPIPAPALDGPAGEAAGLATAVLAGGCFWGVQGIFQHLEGVRSAVSGYAGGEAQTAQYMTVVTGTTGHAEAVEITYDPEAISYGTLLHVFFSAVHDPTQLNRQGPDIGTHYRSAIFPLDDAQAEIAEAYIAQLDAAEIFDAPIVTTIEPGHAFHPAEDYHQDFMTRHPSHPYIVIHDLPKLENFKRLFPGLYRDVPMLVLG